LALQEIEDRGWKIEDSALGSTNAILDPLSSIFYFHTHGEKYSTAFAAILVIW
jgi:hypothetical protein